MVRRLLAVAPLLTAVLATSCATSGREAGRAAVEQLIERELEPGPVWIVRAAWDAAEERIVVADPIQRTVYAFDLEGRIVSRIVRPGEGPLDLTQPAHAFRVNGRVMVGAYPYRWVWLDEDLEPVETFHHEWSTPEEAPYQRLFLYSFDAGSDRFVGVGEAQDHDGAWTGTALWATPYDRSPGPVIQLGTLEVDAEENTALHFSPSKVADCADAAYLLRVAPTLAIERFGESRRTLASFPAEYRQRPDLPLLGACPVDADAREAAVTSTRMADGLFCAENRWLLLLTHDPQPDGTTWTVFPIDPVADLIGAPIVLPTRARSILFVPGTRRWAAIEKGRMQQRDIGQPLVRLVVFPAPDLAAALPRP